MKAFSPLGSWSLRANEVDTTRNVTAVGNSPAWADSAVPFTMHAVQGKAPFCECFFD